METLSLSAWPDYELLDSGFGRHTVVRPDPNVLWEPSHPEHPAWKNPDARFVGPNSPSGWDVSAELAGGWEIAWKDLRFKVRPTPFRHMGLFPEQAAHWQWIEDVIKQAVAQGKKPRCLNLFGYTGGASLAAAKAGATVCHVDASKGSVFWAKENAKLSGLPEDSIRWIVDDVRKFIRREARRGQQYDLILMDPPVFGRGPKGEIWRLEDEIQGLAIDTKAILSKDAVGVLVNAYATTLYPYSIMRVFEAALGRQCLLGSLNIEESLSKKQLPTGYFLRS
jgi:23S rRNA (cytosine1962-C5)-methyltransferase